jgi:uncharacterized DUF497 family protein
MAPMYFEWDENKNRQNLLKHEVRFETAALVFEDPHALTSATSHPTMKNDGSR